MWLLEGHQQLHVSTRFARNMHKLNTLANGALLSASLAQPSD
jgi:hypothetical protein